MNTQTNIKTIENNRFSLPKKESKETRASKIYFVIGVICLIAGGAVLAGILYYGIKYM